MSGLSDFLTQALGLIAVVAVVFAVAPRLYRFGSVKREHYRSRCWPGRDRPMQADNRTVERLSTPVANDAGVSLAARQLDAVMAAPFEKRRLMNFSEYRVFRVIDAEVGRHAGFRVFAQASLGEILQSPDEAAFLSINSKRVDVLVIDRGGWPVLAVEYQGGRHFHNEAAARDAVKKEALRRAGVRYMEVFPDDSNDQIGRRLREALGWAEIDPATQAAPSQRMSAQR
jgi:hypothetical protein